MDYAHRRRIKIWGRAHVVEGDEALIAALMPESYAARPEQVILFDVEAWDTNCSQHIPQKGAVAILRRGCTRAAIGGSHCLSGRFALKPLADQLDRLGQS